MPTSKVAARPAATVMLIRDGVEGIEVLLVRRHGRGFFGGLTVFPGGAVDPVDRSELASSVVIGDSPDQEFRVAALRELAEETGLALTGSGLAPAPPGRGAELLTALGAEGLVLDGSSLVLVSRWVTPEFAPSRFDTRFYLAGVADTPEIRLDPEELVAHMWIDPGELSITVEKGEVALRGKVQTKADAELLEYFATRVPGVVTVHSTLRWDMQGKGPSRTDPRVPEPPARDR